VPDRLPNAHPNQRKADGKWYNKVQAWIEAHPVTILTMLILLAGIFFTIQWIRLNNLSQNNKDLINQVAIGRVEGTRSICQEIKELKSGFRDSTEQAIKQQSPLLKDPGTSKALKDILRTAIAQARLDNFTQYRDPDCAKAVNDVLKSQGFPPEDPFRPATGLPKVKLTPAQVAELNRLKQQVSQP
jgi:hypothetical protein